MDRTVDDIQLSVDQKGNVPLKPKNTLMRRVKCMPIVSENTSQLTVDFIGSAFVDHNAGRKITECYR